MNTSMNIIEHTCLTFSIVYHRGLTFFGPFVSLPGANRLSANFCTLSFPRPETLSRLCRLPALKRSTTAIAGNESSQLVHKSLPFLFSTFIITTSFDQKIRDVCKKGQGS